MKKRLFSIIYVIITAIFMVCMYTPLARADDITSDGLYYSISNNCATITGYNDTISNNVTIPAEINGVPVTSIGMAAFAEAGAATLTPVAGVANQITLTVKDSAGNIDTNFSGSYSVGLSGLKAAPNGSYGSITYDDGTGDQTAGLSLIPILSLNFTEGEASFSLKLNDAENQSIEFNIEGVTAPNTNTLNIKPINGDATQMEVTTQPVPGTGSFSGDAFQTQPAVTLEDQYGNVCISGDSASATVTAAPKSNTTGSWRIAGTRSQSAQSGKAIFTDLGCTVLGQGAGTITFTSGSLSVDSDPFDLPPLKDAKTLTAGNDNDVDHDITITFTHDPDCQTAD